MNKIKKYIYLYLILLATAGLQAQDIHFSQIHASPLLLNPSMTGLFDGGIRYMANARSQWNAFNNGYKTMMISADTKFKEIGKGNLISGGFMLAADRAGDLNFTSTQGSFSISVMKRIMSETYLSFGGQYSLYNQSVDYSKITGLSELTPVIPSSAVNQIFYHDIGAGATFFYAPNPFNQLHIGASINHLNTPDIRFTASENAGDAQFLFKRLVLHAGGTFKFSNYFSIKPNLLFMDQGVHREMNYGSYFIFGMKNQQRRYSKSYQSFHAGAWFRHYLESDIKGIDALILAFKYEKSTFSVGFSYDVNLSTYRNVSRGFGGFEVSISKTIPRVKWLKQKIECPTL